MNRDGLKETTPWLPINAAPKGTEVLVTDGEDCWIATVKNSVAETQPCDTCGNSYFSVVDGWMPLPDSNAKPVVRLPALCEYGSDDQLAFSDGVEACADALREQGFEVVHDDQQNIEGNKNVK